MKHLKMLGLAAMAAMALMAVVGASTASADTLCKEPPNAAGECPTLKEKSNHWAEKTVFKAKASDPTLTVFGSSVATYVTCEESNVNLETTGTGNDTPGSGVPGRITLLTFTGNCRTNTGTSCTVSETSGYTGTLTAVTNTEGKHEGNGTLVATGAGIKTRVSCFGGFFVCEYETPPGGVDLSFKGGNPATVLASGQVLVTLPGGFGCGSEAKWDADYVLTSNTNVWVGTKDA